jgi:hypothetical protein
LKAPSEERMEWIWESSEFIVDRRLMIEDWMSAADRVEREAKHKGHTCACGTVQAKDTKGGKWPAAEKTTRNNDVFPLRRKGGGGVVFWREIRSP